MPNFLNNSVRRRALKEYAKAMRRMEQGRRGNRIWSMGRSHALSQYTERRREMGQTIPNRAERRRK